MFPGIPYTLREEGNLLYGGRPRPTIADGGVIIGGTAAGLVDATTGEGIHEAAMSGRVAANSVAEMRRGLVRDAAGAYERTIQATFYGRLRHRARLMHFLERKPIRFDLLFDQLNRFPKLAALLQRDRNDFSIRGVALSLRAGGAVRDARLAHVITFVAQRFIRLILVLLAITIVSFAFMHAIPGDPVTIRLGDHATPVQVAFLRSSLGLDKPWYVQLGLYLGAPRPRRFGDVGRGPAAGAVQTRRALSGHGRAVGRRAALRDRRRHTGRRFCGAAPEFVFRSADDERGTARRLDSGVLAGWMLVYVFAVVPSQFGLNLFPISGRISLQYFVPPRTHLIVLDALLAGNGRAALDAVWHLVLPAVTLGTIPLAIVAKITRSGMLEVLRADYIRTARAKGLGSPSDRDQTRAAQRADPDSHGHRPADGSLAWRRGPDRAALRLAGRRPARLRRDLESRHAGHQRLHSAVRDGLRRREYGRRRALRAGESPHPVRIRWRTLPDTEG